MKTVKMELNHADVLLLRSAIWAFDEYVCGIEPQYPDSASPEEMRLRLEKLLSQIEKAGA